ncbi:MAG: hypothetical protein WD757_03100 [Actinomycetota bacterium]
MSGHVVPKNAPQIPMPDQLRRPQAMIRPLKEAAKPTPRGPYGYAVVRSGVRPLEVSKGQLNRALRLLQAQFDEAEGKGYEVTEVGHRRDGITEIAIAIKSHPIALTIKERGEFLEVSLNQEYSGRRTWSDGKRARLEQKLGMAPG